MKSYYFLFDLLAYANSTLLLLYAFFCFKVLKNSSNIKMKIIAFYLFFCFLFDSLTRIISKYFVPEPFEDTLFLSITYRLGELIIIGYLIHKHWLKSKLIYVLIVLSSMYLVYDLFTYRINGVLNYTANAQIFANILLLIMLLVNLVKQLKSVKKFSVSNQMLNMVFLSYFSVHLIYTLVINFIINQSYSNNSFTMFYSSYVLLHIVYYFALVVIIYKNYKNRFLIKLL